MSVPTRRQRLRQIAEYLAGYIKRPPSIFSGWGAHRESLPQLVLRAGMTEYGFETGIVASTNHAFTLSVSYMMPEEEATLGCISIDFRRPGDPPGRWTRAMFSPARARILAHHLLVRAERAETKHGLKPLDPPNSSEDL